MNIMHAKIAILGVLAGVVSAIVGSWTIAIESLCILMGMDYATGLILAAVFHSSPKSKNGALESRAAFKGLIRKCGIIVIVIAFHQADRITGKSFLRDGAAFAFCIEEIISLIENLGAMGVPMPAFVTKAIEWLRGKDKNLEIPEMTKKPPSPEGQQIAGATMRETDSSTPQSSAQNDGQENADFSDWPSASVEMTGEDEHI